MHRVGGGRVAPEVRGQYHSQLVHISIGPNLCGLAALITCPINPQRTWTDEEGISLKVHVYTHVLIHGRVPCVPGSNAQIQHSADPLSQSRDGACAQSMKRHRTKSVDESFTRDVNTKIQCVGRREQRDSDPAATKVTRAMVGARAVRGRWPRARPGFLRLPLRRLFPSLLSSTPRPALPYTVRIDGFCPRLQQTTSAAITIARHARLFPASSPRRPAEGHRPPKPLSQYIRGSGAEFMYSSHATALLLEPPPLVQQPFRIPRRPRRSGHEHNNG